MNACFNKIGCVPPAKGDFVRCCEKGARLSTQVVDIFTRTSRSGL